MSLRDVLIDELRDLYSAENQLVKALPKMAKGAHDTTMKDLFTTHLEETKGHVQRLQQAFEVLGEKSTGKHCNGMEGLISEGEEALEEDLPNNSFDCGLAGAALRVEHYEQAGYTVAIAMAKTLELDEITSLLEETLKEEQAAAEKITTASEPVMKSAADEADAEDKPMDAKEKYQAQKSREDEKKAAADVKKHQLV